MLSAEIVGSVKSLNESLMSRSLLKSMSRSRPDEPREKEASSMSRRIEKGYIVLPLRSSPALETTPLLAQLMVPLR